MAKPRMTRKDKWDPSPRAQRYFAWANMAYLMKIDLPTEGANVVFGIPVFPSWSEKKKKAHYWTKHQRTPDVSNLIKALEDALYKDDSKVWHYNQLAKIWAPRGFIRIWRTPVYSIGIDDLVFEHLKQKGGK